jgi:ADP-dependent NAD(P)H-hydrate dehydratase / NAD(P)H-hydrate epimerase
MENAGHGVAQEVCKKLKRREKSLIVIVCGTGNNGGDGFAAARYLYNWGFKPCIFLVGDITQLKTDALVNYRVAKNLGISVKPIDGLDTAFKRSVQSADLIVDAIFGVGLNRPIHEPYCGIIHAINTQGSYVVAVDIPSGLDGTTGGIYGICVKANLTVTFSALKKGFFKKHGPFYTGRHVVVDIGIPHP